MKQANQTIISERAKETIASIKVGTNCKIGLVPPEQIPYVWEKVEEHLLRMAPHSEGELEPDDFFDSLTDGDMQLWLAIENKEIIACMISQFATYPQKRVLRIIFISGDGMDRWIENFPMVENFALMNGCTFLEVWGRKAWVKILKEWDWECKYHIITKDLTARMH